MLIVYGEEYKQGTWSYRQICFSLLLLINTFFACLSSLSFNREFPRDVSFWGLTDWFLFEDTHEQIYIEEQRILIQPWRWFVFCRVSLEERMSRIDRVWKEIQLTFFFVEVWTFLLVLLLKNLFGFRQAFAGTWRWWITKVFHLKTLEHRQAFFF